MCVNVNLIKLIVKCDCTWIFNWCMDEAIPSLLDTNALLRSQMFRTDQDDQFLETAECAY